MKKTILALGIMALTVVSCKKVDTMIENPKDSDTLVVVKDTLVAIDTVSIPLDTMTVVKEN